MKLKINNTTMQIISVFFVLLPLALCQKLCKQIPGDPCACEYNEGRDVFTTQDIEPPTLHTTSGTDPSGKDPMYNYYYKPCGLLKDSIHKDKIPDECKEMSFCQIDSTTSKSYQLAAGPSTMNFIGIPDLDFELDFNKVLDASDTKTRKVKVLMHCDSEFPQHELTFVSQNDTGTKGEEYTLYTFRLTGLYACARANTHKLSAGSVLLILFFVGAILYILVGMLVNKCIRGAQGPEMIPNYAFWSDFPDLLKDGWKFFITCGCCKATEENQGYDNI